MVRVIDLSQKRSNGYLLQLIHAEARRRGRRWFIIIDDAMKAFLEGGRAEVDQ